MFRKNMHIYVMQSYDAGAQKTYMTVRSEQ